MKKTPEQIYRYRSEFTKLGTVKVFESRYYADKYIKDHFANRIDYEVSFDTNFKGFVILRLVRTLLTDFLNDDASDNG